MADSLRLQPIYPVHILILGFGNNEGAGDFPGYCRGRRRRRRRFRSGFLSLALKIEKKYRTYAKGQES